MWQPVWTWVDEHWKPFLDVTHYLHLSLSSSSEALKSDATLAALLPLPLRGAGGSGFDTFLATFPWIFSWILIGSKPKILFFFCYSSSFGSLFSSGWVFT